MKKDHAEMSRRNFVYGRINPQMVCPHCQKRGSVRTKTNSLEQYLASQSNGQIRRQIDAHCDNCEMSWTPLSDPKETTPDRSSFFGIISS